MFSISILILVLGLLQCNSSMEVDQMHVIFSTDCSFFQDWQTLLVFHSAVVVKQKGRITRIASGCDASKQGELLNLYEKLFPQYSVHFTPDYKLDEKTKTKYAFYNKPYGVRHWLENSVPPIESGVIVALIDPDFIFLRPLETQVQGHPSNIFMDGYNMVEDKVPIKVARGYPVSQKYGLGAPWTNPLSRNFDKHAICGEGSPCLNVSHDNGDKFYRFYIVLRCNYASFDLTCVLVFPFLMKQRRAALHSRARGSLQVDGYLDKIRAQVIYGNNNFTYIDFT